MFQSHRQSNFQAQEQKFNQTFKLKN